MLRNLIMLLAPRSQGQNQTNVLLLVCRGIVTDLHRGGLHVCSGGLWSASEQARKLSFPGRPADHAGWLHSSCCLNPVLWTLLRHWNLLPCDKLFSVVSHHPANLWAPQERDWLVGPVQRVCLVSQGLFPTPLVLSPCQEKTLSSSFRGNPLRIRHLLSFVLALSPSMIVLGTGCLYYSF